MMSDLRESGAIEQDADLVTFIYRPEYYKIDEWDDEERSPAAGQAEFIVAQHRNGGLDSIRLKFIGKLGKFDNLDQFDAPIEFQSKINGGKQQFDSQQPSPDEAFGIDEDDMPF